MNSVSLTDKRILITGAARGLGRGFAEAAAGAGARLVLADILEARFQSDASFREALMRTEDHILVHKSDDKWTKNA